MLPRWWMSSVVSSQLLSRNSWRTDGCKASRSNNNRPPTTLHQETSTQRRYGTARTETHAQLFSKCALSMTKYIFGDHFTVSGKPLFGQQLHTFGFAVTVEWLYLVPRAVKESLVRLQLFRGRHFMWVSGRAETRTCTTSPASWLDDKFSSVRDIREGSTWARDRTYRLKFKCDYCN